MQLIKNNPYRIVGLLVGASPKDQKRQIGRLINFIDAKQDPDEDFSFPTLGNLHRTIDSVNDAASKLNLDSDKMSAALFWFYKGNAITDEPALDALKEADQQTSTEIWTKLTATGEVTQRNSSAFQNLSTLSLCNAFNGSTVNANLVEQGISLKLKFLESDFIKELQERATDKTYKATKKELQLLFLNQVQSEIGKSGEITSYKFIEILSKQVFSAKDDFLKGFVQKPIEQIEKIIEDAKDKRRANKASAVNIGTILYEQTHESLSQLKSILGISNIKFSSISDRVSEEVLQCGEDYFFHHKESKADPGSASMDLYRKAKALAIGNIVKQRSQEKMEYLQQWIDDAPNRKKQILIEESVQFIISKIETFQNISAKVSNAKDLVDSCKPRLLVLKNALGLTDDGYIKISSTIVSNAEGMLVTAVNNAQEVLRKYQELDAKTKRILGKSYLDERDELLQIINNAYDVTTSMQSMDMVHSAKESFQKNRAILSLIRNNMTAGTDPSPRTTPRIPTGTPPRHSGCYIATMAYGDYDHPQVVILRQFRDNVLNKSILGRWLIRTYYHYSPKLVEKLKYNKTVNSIIRKSFNEFIKVIK